MRGCSTSPNMERSYVVRGNAGLAIVASSYFVPSSRISPSCTQPPVTNLIVDFALGTSTTPLPCIHASKMTQCTTLGNPILNQTTIPSIAPLSVRKIDPGRSSCAMTCIFCASIKYVICCAPQHFRSLYHVQMYLDRGGRRYATPSRPNSGGCSTSLLSRLTERAASTRNCTETFLRSYICPTSILCRYTVATLSA